MSIERKRAPKPENITVSYIFVIGALPLMRTLIVIRANCRAMVIPARIKVAVNFLKIVRVTRAKKVIIIAMIGSLALAYLYSRW
tara:strand:+ start:368 stop:619 length:252 start_codon:yes stop_codon:yes gene_type:complete